MRGEIHKRIHLRVGTIFGVRMTWEQAKEYAEDRAMRLPTRLEALAMIEAGMELPEWFWTCDEYSSTIAWYAASSGGVHTDIKSGELFAVPVVSLD